MHRLGSAAILIVTFIASLTLFKTIWDRDALEDIATQPGGWWGAIGIVIGSAVVHELLHAIGWRVLANVPWSSIAVRPTWSVMGFAVHSDARVSVRTWRAVTILPAVILGILPIAIGLATGNGLVLLWGLFFFFECFADLTALLARRA